MSDASDTSGARFRTRGLTLPRFDWVIFMAGILGFAWAVAGLALH